MNKREWLSWVRRRSCVMLVSASLVVVVLLQANNLSNVRAQETIKQRPNSGHVAELARYFDHLELSEPVVCRHLSVFPLRLRDGDKLRGGWLTMDQAISRGVLVVTEKSGGGEVPIVSVENRSRDDTVFIMSGEVLAGGKQTRTVRQDVVLAPGQRIDLDVLCVEARRWEGKADFTAGKTLLPQSIQKEIRKGADQQRVWQEIARNNMALGAENETGSLELALNSGKVKNQLGEVRERIMPKMPRDTVGFIFVDGRRAVGAHFFGREDLAIALLPKLLDAYAVDLILQRETNHRVDRKVNDDTAVAFFRQIRKAGSQRSKTPGSGAGIRTRRGELLGDGVSLGGVVVHYGVQIQERLVPLPKR